MQQLMSVVKLRAHQNNKQNAPSPLARAVDGIPWLTFRYTTRSTTKEVTIRVDVNTIDNLEVIPLEVRHANCLYPSADGPEQSYKGNRRDYERECNEQGWKLVHLNTEILNGKRGLLQQAVVNLRNATAEQISRRAKKQGRNNKGQGNLEGGGVVPQPHKLYHGPVVALPRINPETNPPRSRQHQHTEVYSRIATVVRNPERSKALSWQPTFVSSLQQSIQHSQAESVESRQRRGGRPENLDNPERQFQRPSPSATRDPLALRPINHTSRAAQPNFTPPEDSIDFIELEQCSKGQIQKIRIRCDIDHVAIKDLSLEFKKSNCVYLTCI